MPELDPLLLSRIQFAFTISFHILFPSFTIGLAAWLLVLEILWLRTGKVLRSESESETGRATIPSTERRQSANPAFW